MSFEPSRRRRTGARTRRILRGLQIVAFVTAALGLVLAWQESEPFTNQVLTIAERVATYEEFADRPARFYEMESRLARRARIEACVSDWLDTVNSGADKETGAKLAESCLHIVRRSLTMAPASSSDWAIAAFLAGASGDLASTSEYLRRSLATGPTEQWIARRRAILMFQLGDGLDPDLRAEIDPQLKLLLRSDEGVQGVAQMYLENAAFRERIVSVAETLEPVYQKRFLDYVRRWAPLLKQAPAPANSG